MDRKHRTYTEEERRARIARAFAALRSVQARPQEQSTQQEGQQEQAKADTEANTEVQREKRATSLLTEQAEERRIAALLRVYDYLLKQPALKIKGTALQQPPADEARQE